jgi:hypothetical protein
MHERSEDGANDIIFQRESSQTLALMILPANDGNLEIKVQFPERLESSRNWLDRRGGSSVRSQWDGIAKEIAAIALTHSFVPNVAAEKEPSSSSGELWIAGLRRFIVSG